MFDVLGAHDMKYDSRKIANSFYLPGHSFLRGIASLIDFTGSESREFTESILARSDAEVMRADWEAVGESLWQAIDKRRNDISKGSNA